MQIEKIPYLVTAPGNVVSFVVTGLKAAEDHHDVTIIPVSAETTLPGVSSEPIPVVTTAGMAPLCIETPSRSES